MYILPFGSSVGEGSPALSLPLWCAYPYCSDSNGVGIEDAGDLLEEGTKDLSGADVVGRVGALLSSSSGER